MNIILRRDKTEELRVIAALDEKFRKYALFDKNLIRDIIKYERDVCLCGNEEFKTGHASLQCIKCSKFRIEKIHTVCDFDNACGCGQPIYKYISGGDANLRCSSCYRIFKEKSNCILL